MFSREASSKKRFATWFAGLSVLGVVAASCGEGPPPSIPAFADGGLLRLTTPLTAPQLAALEGMYTLSYGSELLGGDLAIRAWRGGISLLSGKDAAYAPLGIGCMPSGDRVVIEGYWRYPRTGEAGLVRMDVLPVSAAKSLCAGVVPAKGDIMFAGAYAHGSMHPTDAMAFTFQRDLIPYHGRFFAFAHHGACETTDPCGAALNSVETIRLAEAVGSNGVEIDIRMTKDNVPVLFHDPMFAGETTRGRFCIGKVEEMTLPEIRALCRLPYGEAIPTLDEALRSVLDETDLEAVYLDMKVPEAVAPSVALAKAYNAEAVAKGRKLRVAVALTKDSVTDAWNAIAPAKDDPPCVFEYDPDRAISQGCVAWTPTFTEGPRVEDVERVRAGGLGVVYWTVNSEELIRQFLEQGNPNGFISARPSLVFYEYQKRGVVAPLASDATTEAR
jgi:glycerophosphoryl diester phosphodiesterase